MSRWLAILLLLMLPLSWTTAAVAGYCKHESSPAEQHHLGHHLDADQISPAADNAADPNQSNDGNPVHSTHANCSVTHAFCSVLPGLPSVNCLPVGAQLPPLQTVSPSPSGFPEEPERPKWPVAA